MNKDTTFNFIHCGKQYSIRCKYSCLYMGVIPVYIGNNIEGVQVIRLSNREIFIISPYKNIDIQFEISVWNSLLQMYSVEYLDLYIRNLCIAYWYGFNNTIESIKKNTSLSDYSKNRTIRYLEQMMISKNDIIIPDRNMILNSLKYIDIK